MQEATLLPVAKPRPPERLRIDPRQAERVDGIVHALAESHTVHERLDVAPPPGQRVVHRLVDQRLALEPVHGGHAQSLHLGTREA